MKRTIIAITIVVVVLLTAGAVSAVKITEYRRDEAKIDAATEQVWKVYYVCYEGFDIWSDDLKKQLKHTETELEKVRLPHTPFHSLQQRCKLVEAAQNAGYECLESVRHRAPVVTWQGKRLPPGMLISTDYSERHILETMKKNLEKLEQ